MKKGQTKNIKSSKASFGYSAKGRTSPKQRASIVVKGVNSVNYAKAISYIVKSEENETSLMIASASTFTSH